MCRRNRSLDSVERFLDFMPGGMKLCSAGGPAHEAYLATATGVIPIFAIDASISDNGPVAALERPLPLLGFQRLGTRALLPTWKRVEHLSAVTLPTSLEGRSTRSVGRESLGLKRKRKGASVYLLMVVDEVVC
jgi:hypothetical protein